MMIRSLTGLLISVMLVLGFGDAGRERRFGPRFAGNFGLGGFIEDTLLELLLFGRGGVERFATLPPGPDFPEGIAADKPGNIYVVRGLLFPASIVLSRGSIFVTNLALPLTNDVTGDEPEEDVHTYTVSRIRLGFHD